MKFTALRSWKGSPRKEKRERRRRANISAVCSVRAVIHGGSLDIKYMCRIILVIIAGKVHISSLSIVSRQGPSQSTCSIYNMYSS